MLLPHQIIDKFRRSKKNLTAKKFDRIALPTTEGFTFVKNEDILRCEANGNYTAFFLTSGKKMLITKTLKYYDEMLADSGFFRTHKSHLINLQYISKFIKGKQGYVEMIDKSRLEVSTRKREELLKRLM